MSVEITMRCDRCNEKIDISDLCACIDSMRRTVLYHACPACAKEFEVVRGVADNEYIATMDGWKDRVLEIGK